VSYLLDTNVLSEMERRVFLTNGLAAAEWGRIKSRGERSGRPISDRDAWIAVVAIIHGLTLVTRNVDDFSGYGGELLNPWI
jgi:predicted nucleic acid-binding protein